MFFLVFNSKNDHTILKGIYHLETTDFNRWVTNYLDQHLSSFQNITSNTYIDVMFLKRR
jgi:hypothetical protein